METRLAGTGVPATKDPVMREMPLLSAPPDIGRQVGCRIADQDQLKLSDIGPCRAEGLGRRFYDPLLPSRTSRHQLTGRRHVPPFRQSDCPSRRESRDPDLSLAGRAAALPANAFVPVVLANADLAAGAAVRSPRQPRMPRLAVRADIHIVKPGNPDTREPAFARSPLGRRCLDGRRGPPDERGPTADLRVVTWAGIGNRAG